MPGFNQTDPMGDGPMTVRRMGKCTNYGAKVKAKDVSKDESQNQEITENTNEQVSESGGVRNIGFGRSIGRFEHQNLHNQEEEHQCNYNN